jgi:hypothetical protein
MKTKAVNKYIDGCRRFVSEEERIGLDAMYSSAIRDAVAECEKQKCDDDTKWNSCVGFCIAAIQALEGEGK